MRLEFDEQGYVCCVLYGCSTGSCVDYAGLVPSEPEEYADLDDWADRAEYRAYKLDDEGNLSYDATRAEELAAAYEEIPGSYKTGEVKTGDVWIDGKPIYRYMVEIGSIAVGGKQAFPLDLGGTMIDKVVALRGMACMDIYNGTWVSLPYADYDANWTIPLTLYAAGRTAPELTVYANKLYAITGGYALVEYTKK